MDKEKIMDMDDKELFDLLKYLITEKEFYEKEIEELKEESNETGTGNTL